MADDRSADAQAAASRVLELEAELEAAGEATLGGDGLAAARAALHEWVDTVAGVVTTPALGRVTLIHANGKRSSIASSELPYKVTTQIGQMGMKA